MQVAILGAGAMGGGIARGLIDSGFPSCDIVISNPTASKLTRFEEAGCRVTSSNVEAVASGAEIIFLCVKPWKVSDVLSEIAPAIDRSRQTLGVVAAGVKGARLAELLPDTRMYIVMPNTGLNIGASMTLVVDVVADDASRRQLHSLLSRVGAVMAVDEAQLPAATAIASCGIAYLMRYARAAQQAGVAMGLRPAQACYLAAMAMQGAGRLLARPDAHPEVEIDKVTTPGGLTIRGLNTLDACGFSNAVISAILASK